MNLQKIVFLDASTVDAGDVDLGQIAQLADAYQAYPMTKPEDVISNIGDADVVLTNKVVISNAVMGACTNLKLICVTATGTNNVDLESAAARGIAVCNVAGYSTNSVTQHTISLLLNMFSSIHKYAGEHEKWAESPIFTRLDYSVSEVSGKVLGIAGLGSIGNSVANVAEALGMKVVGLARGSSSGDAARPRLLKQDFFGTSDVVSLHCPLTPQTHHLIRAETIGMIKPGAFLINTGRGDLVDEVALAGALKSGRLGGAALDVLSEEPPKADHPLLRPDIPNLIVTPHSAWAAVESRRKLMEEVAENIRAFCRGEERNRVG